MPLPPALAARLAKRGLLKDTVENSPAEKPSSVAAFTEEVIAEDYDDDNPQPLSHAEVQSISSKTVAGEQESNGSLIYETVACPNKSNIYHKCVPYCMQKWGMKTFLHAPPFDRKRESLLRRYPLPPGWVEVGDPETGRYYYWNTETDEVSWLPPQHPRAVVTLPEERLKELAQANSADVLKSRTDKSRPGVGRGGGVDSEGESDANSTDLDDEENEDDLDEEQDFEQLEKEVLKRKKQSEQDRGIVKKRRDTKLDPMDPAAYSDVPKGGWTVGLEMKGSAKTGADVTAAGPLFQQRPYPSPGAILRMNDGKK